MVQGSFQWVDIDPFGSPISFIDGALQALGRVGVLEVWRRELTLVDERGHEVAAVIHLPAVLGAVVGAENPHAPATK